MPCLQRIRCTRCKEWKGGDQFHNKANAKLKKSRTCKDCAKVYATQWRKDNPGYQAQHRYNLSIEDIAKMLKDQGGTCANDACDYGKDDDHKLFIDHDHETGKVRGLLCAWCNTAEGYLKGSPELAVGLIRYMRKHNGEKEES